MNNKTRVDAISSLFQKLQDKNDFTPVPALYGTQLWSNAVISALGSKAKISTTENTIKINFPGEKTIKFSFQEFWEISCLSSCSNHSLLYLGNNVDFWEHERPWQALQEYNLKHCRSPLAKVQVQYLKTFINVLQDLKLPIPQISGLTFGWAWMFEKSPGVWPPAETINPRSCLFDPILGILSFQDIYQYLNSEKLPAKAIWAHELSLCLATNCVQSNLQEYLDKADTFINNHEYDRIVALVQTLSTPLSVYNCDLAQLLTSTDKTDVLAVIAIMLLGWKLLKQSGIPNKVRLSKELRMEFSDVL